MSIEDPSYDELASNCCAQAIAIGKIRDILAEFTATPHNTGSPKLPPCEECGSVAITNALFELGERFCKYCGRQLRASA